MGVEFLITKELTNTALTLTELTAIDGIVRNEIRSGEFADQFQSMMNELAKCYDVVDANLSPLIALDSQDAFMERFDQRRADYGDNYLSEISRPRIDGEEAYEIYLVMKTHRQYKTGFPLLKRTFGRLDELVDKWITNDAWLAMSIDTAFKMMQRLLNEIAELKTKDAEDAWMIYRSASMSFAPHLELIRDLRQRLEKPDA